MGEFVLFIDEIPFNSSISYCRICHEAEFESDQSLEAPCACSGTVKFAHRDCIQRWCNEKGNTNCEICLQVYAPGYTAPSKKSQSIESALTIRDSLQTPRRTQVEPRRLRSAENELPQCTYSRSGASSCCRSLAVSLTLFLLVKDIFAVLSGEISGYPFALATIVLARVSGILLPMFVIMKIIAAIRNGAGHLRPYHDSDNESSDAGEEGEDVEQPRNTEL